MPEITSAQVEEMLTRMKAAQPTCSGCEWRSFDAALKLVDTTDRELADREMKAAGYEMFANAPVYVLRCKTCRESPLFPWADQLDPAKVLEFVNSDPRCQGAVWPLAILEETINAG